MSKRIAIFAVISALACLFLYVTFATAQYPVMDAIANRIISRYQQSTCEELREKRAHKTPPTPQEQNAIELLKNDPQMRAAFINKIGTKTDMVAYAGDGVFAQIWIGTADKLPRLIHAIYLDDPAQLRHNLLISNWQLDQPVPADAFAPSNAANAKPIKFAHPNPQPPPGAKPPAKSKATTAK